MIVQGTYILPQSEQNGKISGLVYADYFYNVSRDSYFDSLRNTALTGQQELNGFDIRRIYFTYDYKISGKFTTRFRVEGDGRALTRNERFGVFIKDAFIKWNNILPGQDIIFGIQPTPAFEVSESVYGFRSLEKTILDLRGIVSSRDFGLAMRGKITDQLNYWILLGNNSGNSPETDRYKRLYGHLSFKPLKNFVTTIYGDLRFRQRIRDPLNTEGSLIGHNTITTALFFGYNNPDLFALGAEGFYTITENDVPINNVLETRNGMGISLFGSAELMNDLIFTARYDIFDPSSNEDIKHDKRDFYIIGLSYKPVEGVAVIPNVMVENYEDLPGLSVDPSLTARLTIAYEFF